ncbi:hypothetical protein [Streptomyces mayteni]
MPDFNFTPDEVEEKAGRKPWTRQREFAEEIRPDDMADTAAVYARAAGEAADAGELASQATETGIYAGGLDGDSLVDGDGRIDETAEGLQGNGQDIDRVVGYLVRAMNRAIDADDEVLRLVLGDGGLEEGRTRHVSAAINEWNGWQSALEAAVAAMPAAPTSVVRPIAPLDVSYRGRTLGITPEQDWSRAVYSLRGSLADEIRDRHLQDAADDAVATDGEITEAIEAYRTRLAEFGQELGDLGYDLSGGPFDLFTTEEMATFAGQRIAEELAKEHPDRDVLLRYTEGLDGIALGVFADPDKPGSENLSFLNPQERAYLLEFYEQLDAEDLAALGALRDPEGDNTALRRVANGINLLTGAEYGGIDITIPENKELIPDGIREYVYDYREGTGLYPIGNSEYRPALRRFNDFGALLSTATVPPGDVFATDLAHAAVDVQFRTNSEYLGTDNTFSRDLLRTTSLNTGASADLLNDDVFRDNLLGLHWEDSSGAGDLIRAGTTVPDGVDHNSDEARAYVEAAYHVLTDAPDHRNDVLAQGLPGYFPADHTALQDAIGDTAVQYLDMVSKASEDSSFDVPTDPDDPNARTDRDLYGTDYRYSFGLSRDDRQGLFDMLLRGESDASQDFLDGVTTWQEVTAYNAFTRDPEGRHDEGAAFEGIGRIAGTVENAQNAAVSVGDENRRQASAVTAIGQAGAMVRDMVAPLPAKMAIRVGAYGLGEMFRYSQPDPAIAAENTRLDSIQYGDWVTETIVARAAVAADYDGLGDTRFRDPSTDPDVSKEDLHREVIGVSGRYSWEASQLDRAYKETVG